MIKVEHLTKRYAGYTAIDDLNFEVAQGEIVGFLGPNGAGKSTTMKILSGFLPASKGRALIAGHNVFTDSLAVRQNVGYLPENVPLYSDMRVHEYLKYRGALKGLRGRKLKERVGAVSEVTDLKGVSRKLIGKLSKGFRQRVGIAEAMIHEPPLLLLDEPTIGLDPNQIRSARELIKSLRKNHTVFLSTHILSEVEMTCDRVVIINKGKIVAVGTPTDLPYKLRSAGNVRVEVSAPNDDPIMELGRIPGIKEIIRDTKKSRNGTNNDPYYKLILRAESGVDPRAAIYRMSVDRNWSLRELTQRQATLEDVFVEITHAD